MVFLYHNHMHHFQYIISWYCLILNKIDNFNECNIVEQDFITIHQYITSNLFLLVVIATILYLCSGLQITNLGSGWEKKNKCKLKRSWIRKAAIFLFRVPVTKRGVTVGPLRKKGVFFTFFFTKKGFRWPISSNGGGGV